MSNAVFLQAMADYRNALTEYRADADSFFLGDMLGMEMEQTIKVGDKTIKAASGSNKAQSVVTQCPLSGTLRLVHMFESTRFIPIGNTPYKVEAVKRGPYGSFVSDKVVKEGTLDAKGIAEIGNLTPGQSYRVTFYPNVTKSDLDGLFSSYQTVQADLAAWLERQWASTHQPAWRKYQGSSGEGLAVAAGALRGLGKALASVWDDLVGLYDLLAHPMENAEKLLEFGVNAPDLAAAGAEKIENAMLVLQDEALLYLYVYALVSWVKMLPPDELAEFGTQMVATVLLDILIGVVLTGGAGLAIRHGGKAVTKVMGATKQQDRLADLSADLIEMSQKHNLAAHVQAAKPVLVSGHVPLNPLKKADLTLTDNQASTAVEDAAAAARKYEQHTKIEQVNRTPDDSTPATNSAGDNNQSAAKTCTDGCPVSMVTGEELLALTDGELPGLLPFRFGRLYRTSAVEQQCGLGPGWSHGLAHRLARSGDRLTWWDEEALAISLPMPTQQRPMVTNRLAEAAVYLGDEANEVIVAKAGSPFLHFTLTGQQGRLSALSDSYGNRLTVRSDEQGRVYWLEHAGGLALRLGYQNERITRLDLLRHDGVRWVAHALLQRYHYNDAGQLVAAENGAGEQEQYRYRADGVIVERRLAGGAGFFWEWQGEGKQARAIRHWSDVAGFDARYEWDDAKGEVSVQNGDGSVVVYQHDSQARLIRQQDPDGAVSEFGYNDKGQKVWARDAQGSETHYLYDEAGLLAHEVAADGSLTRYAYWDGHLRKVEQCGAEGGAVRTWRFERNEQGDVLVKTDPLGRQTHYTYTAQGKLATLVQPDGSRIELSWNRLGQLLEEKGADGTLTRWRYDERGRQIVRQDPRGGVTRYEWDGADRLQAVQLPGGGVRQFEYNAYGKVTRERDEQGRETRYEYHPGLHLVSRRINPDGSELKYRYDNAKLFLSELENEQGERHHIHYYPNGLIASETGFDGRTTAYRYDLTGQLLEKSELGEQGGELITRYQRDAMGRLVQKTLPDGQQIAYRYDGHGQLTEVDDGQWPLHFEYDKAGQLIAEHQGWASSYFGYNALGQLAHWQLPDGNQLAYHYRHGELLGLDLNGQELTRHKRVGGVEQMRRQGALLTQYQYDEQGRLTALRQHRGERQTRERRYGYGHTGNLLHVHDSVHGEQHYRYDPLDRLLEVRGGLNEYFQHDRAGNLLGQSDGIGKLVANSQRNRLLLSGDRHFEYDEFGRLARERRGKGQRLVTRYHYDGQHQLSKVELPDGSLAHYRYDAFGRRIKKTVVGKSGQSNQVHPEFGRVIDEGGFASEQHATQPQVETVTEFLWQGNQLIAESSYQVSGDNQQRTNEQYRSFIYEPESFKPLVQLEGEGQQAEAYHYQLDHLGTPLALTRHNGATVWQVRYRAYGNVWQKEVADLAAPIETPLRFQGQYWDAETGLHYNRHRYYQPDTGRFISPDPIGLAGGINNYQYAPNPIGWVDPLGLMNIPGECPPPKTAEADPIQPDRQGGPEEPPSVGQGTSKVDKFSRSPKSIQDQMTLEAAREGQGDMIIKNLNDPKFKGMEKIELKVKSANGNDSVVHYVRDPKTGELMDFKFKKHSTEGIKPWGNDPSVPPGG